MENSSSHFSTLESNIGRDQSQVISTELGEIRRAIREIREMRDTFITEMRDIITEMRDIIRREMRARDTIRRLSSSRTVPYPHAQNELEQSEAEREWQSQEVNAGDGEQLREGNEEDAEYRDFPDLDPEAQNSQRVNSIPDNFEFGQHTPRLMWLLWNFGKPLEALPPYRNFTRRQLNQTHQSQVKRLPEVKFLMGKIEARARELNFPLPPSTVRDAKMIWSACKDVIDIPATTPRGQVRRKTTLVWRSWYNIYLAEVLGRRRS